MFTKSWKSLRDKNKSGVFVGKRTNEQTSSQLAKYGTSTVLARISNMRGSSVFGRNSHAIAALFYRLLIGFQRHVYCSPNCIYYRLSATERGCPTDPSSLYDLVISGNSNTPSLLTLCQQVVIPARFPNR